MGPTPTRSPPHAGLDPPVADFDRTYGALGSQVARQDEGRPGPIRELYLVGAGDVEDPAAYRTEICWPVRPA